MDTRDSNDREDKIKTEVCRILDWSVLTDDQLLQLPNGVFAYNLHPSVLQMLNCSKKLSDIAVLPRGLGSNKAVRTYRAWYEVPIGSIEAHGRYRSLCNGGEFSPFYREDAGVADWIRADGCLLVEVGYEDGFVAYDQKNTEHYFAAGLSFPKQSTIFNVAVLPIDAIPTREGKAIILYHPENRWFLLGYLNSGLVRHFVDVTTGLHKQSGSIGMIPIPQLPSTVCDAISTISQNLTYTLYMSLTLDESSRLFLAPLFDGVELEVLSEGQFEGYQKIDDLIADALGFDLATRKYFGEKNLKLIQLYTPTKKDILSYSVGCIFGRWDVRIACDQSLRISPPDPFDALPICPPGLLIDPSGLPATPGQIISEEWLRARANDSTLSLGGTIPHSTIPDSAYPLKISWRGILVDDPDHPDDIVQRVRDALGVIWKGNAEAIEQEVCQILGVKELREYFRRPGNDGFWMDHVKRYSKSRRKAPIYWMLQSSKKNYALWLYYHHLDKDTLFKALTKYVEPKIRLEDSRLEQWRAQLTATASTGREARQLEQQVDRQEGLVAEMYDFRDKLRSAADLNLEPDLNDGVVLNIAPLRELVPWSEAKKYWDELLAGKYEWSSISKQLRSKGVI